MFSYVYSFLNNLDLLKLRTISFVNGEYGDCFALAGDNSISCRTTVDTRWTYSNTLNMRSRLHFL